MVIILCANLHDMTRLEEIENLQRKFFLYI